MNSKEKVAQYRTKRRVRAEMRLASCPTALVPLPSGEEWELRRIPRDLFVLFGRLPQSLTAKGMEAWKDTPDGQLVLSGEDPDEKRAAEERLAASFGAEENVALGMYMSEVVRMSAVSPRVINHGSDDDALLIEEVDPADLEFIFKWQMEGAIVVPVKTTEGDLPHAALESFRGGQARVSDDLGGDSGEVRAIAESPAGDS